MGGNNSTEVQVVEPVPKPFQIPTIPFWDGQPVLIMWVPVDIEYKHAVVQDLLQHLLINCWMLW